MYARGFTDSELGMFALGALSAFIGSAGAGFLWVVL